MMKSLFTLSLLPLSVFSAWAPPGPDGKYTLTAEGVTAKFIPYAASITNLWVQDRNGTLKDIILGYDNASFYPVDPNHPDYGAVPGRYANRIANHTYAINGTRYYTEANDGNGTLHSGLNGWSRRMWNVSDVTNTSITFTIRDESNSSLGMLGTVIGTVTHTLTKKAWKINLHAVSLDVDTPIMLTSHPYWNLDSFQNPSTDLILNHTLSLPFSKRIMGIDPSTQCTGALPDVAAGSINDFYSKPKQLGMFANSTEWVGNCGTGSGCSGYNNQWTIDRTAAEVDKPVASLASDYSGIKWDLYTDQPGVVVYTCYWMGGEFPSTLPETPFCPGKF